MLTEKRLLELGFEYRTVKEIGRSIESVPVGYYHPKLGTIYLMRYSSSAPFLVKTIEGSQLTSIDTEVKLDLFFLAITGSPIALEQLIFP